MMRIVTYGINVFFYAKELFILTSFLTVCFVLCVLFAMPLEGLIVSAKIVLPLVFYAMQKMSNQSRLYFLYNLGMHDRVIVCWLLFFSLIDVLLIQILFL